MSHEAIMPKYTIELRWKFCIIFETFNKGKVLCGLVFSKLEITVILYKTIASIELISSHWLIKRNGHKLCIFTSNLNHEKYSKCQ